MRWLLLLVLFSACTLYGDDAPIVDDCDEVYVPYELVNPSDLTCQDFGGYQCATSFLAPGSPEDRRTRAPFEEEPLTGLRALRDARFLVPIPGWGACDSPCRALSESACLSTPACRGVYDYACFTGDSPCTALVPFVGCYPVDQSGPIQGACDNLDAQSCSLHDDCIALHDSAAGNAFRSCVSESR